MILSGEHVRPLAGNISNYDHKAILQSVVVVATLLQNYQRTHSRRGTDGHVTRAPFHPNNSLHIMLIKIFFVGVVVLLISFWKQRPRRMVSSFVKVIWSAWFILGNLFSANVIRLLEVTVSCGLMSSQLDFFLTDWQNLTVLTELTEFYSFWQRIIQNCTQPN